MGTTKSLSDPNVYASDLIVNTAAGNTTLMTLTLKCSQNEPKNRTSN